jgi:hypothetical protein
MLGMGIGQSLGDFSQVRAMQMKIISALDANKRCARPGDIRRDFSLPQLSELSSFGPTPSLERKDAFSFLAFKS